MDPYSSGEDLVVKTRKPYTITKQRERWTDEEHNRFLEALKLYGRAWQRIEEYIGTKTAVQIRSHAQKFFTKLEKEAVIKGTSIGHALDIEIPPPRPKRKPSNPYPRKSSVGITTLQVGVKDGKTAYPDSSSQVKITLDLDKEPEESIDDGKLLNNERYIRKDYCSGLLISKTTPCTSLSSAIRSSSTPEKSCISKEGLRLPSEASNKDRTTESYITTEAEGLRADESDSKKLYKENGSIHTSNIMKSERVVEMSQYENNEILPEADVQASQNYPRHVPVHILDQNASADITFDESLLDNGDGVSGPKKLFPNAAASISFEHHTTTSCSPFHPSLPCYHPIQNQDDYRSFLQISSTFSSLIVSTLLQNPAAHAAASFAATLWPSVNIETVVEPSGVPTEPFLARQNNQAPSVAAIAAATVAAATAWWAAHGLIPLCAPFHPTFACSPTSASATPKDGQPKRLSSEKIEVDPDPVDLGEKQLEPECSQTLHEKHSALKSPTVSSSNPEKNQCAKELTAIETTEPTDITELQGANKSKNRKNVDRSSCGSNTPSSSDVEADALEKQTQEENEKHVKDNEELKELDVVHYVNDLCGRRCRSTCAVNDPRKEVSEEALFSREVLPQSFSPHDLENVGKNTNTYKLDTEVHDENWMQFDLNRKTWDTRSQKHEVEEKAFLMSLNKEEDPLNMGLGHAKLKAHRTGFKPYKRCSMEAKDIRMSGNCQDEEKALKRLRLEREAFS